MDAAKKDRVRAPRRTHKNMYRDLKGFWWIDYYSPDGKRRRKKCGKTKESADRALHAIRGAMNDEKYIDPAYSPTFSAFADTFLERHGNHLASYKKNGRIIHRLKSFLGKIKLVKITAGHIEQYRLLRLAQPDARDGKSALSRTTINREIEILRSILSKAVKWDVLSKNPAVQVQDYAEDNKRIRYLSGTEKRRLLQATKYSHSTLLRPAVYLALQTGMRKGELLGLKWSDINFESNEILCRETKSGEPRHVPMSRRARWVLSKLAAKNPLSTWVFESTSRDGTKAPARDVKTAWETALRRAQIDNFRFHDLRHSFASHYAMNEGNLYALAEILGHANPLITMKRYAHLSRKFKSEQIKVMDKSFSASA